MGQLKFIVQEALLGTESKRRAWLTHVDRSVYFFKLHFNQFYFMQVTFILRNTYCKTPPNKLIFSLFGLTHGVLISDKIQVLTTVMQNVVFTWHRLLANDVIDSYNLLQDGQ